MACYALCTGEDRSDAVKIPRSPKTFIELVEHIFFRLTLMEALRHTENKVSALEMKRRV